MGMYDHDDATLVWCDTGSCKQTVNGTSSSLKSLFSTRLVYVWDTTSTSNQIKSIHKFYSTVEIVEGWYYHGRVSRNPLSLPDQLLFNCFDPQKYRLPPQLFRLLDYPFENFCIHCCKLWCIILELVHSDDTCAADAGGSVSHERRLMKCLLENYDKSVRPVFNPEDTLNVTLEMNLLHLLSFVSSLSLINQDPFFF